MIRQTFTEAGNGTAFLTGREPAIISMTIQSGATVAIQRYIGGSWRTLESFTASAERDIRDPFGIYYRFSVSGSFSGTVTCIFADVNSITGAPA